MRRVRISTTVDGEQLQRARAIAKRPDAELFDYALALFIQAVEGEREREILHARPYDDDPELAMPVSGMVLPYDGDVPADVLRLAEERRRQR
jgi:hypothetical protein